jgi:hypothetical protein
MGEVMRKIIQVLACLQIPLHISAAFAQSDNCRLDPSLAKAEIGKLEANKLLELSDDKERSYIIEGMQRKDLVGTIEDWQDKSQVFLARDACALLLSDFLQAEHFFVTNPEGMSYKVIVKTGRAALADYLNLDLEKASNTSVYAVYSEKLGRGALTINEPGKYGRLETVRPHDSDASVSVDEEILGAAGDTYQVLSGDRSLSMDGASGNVCRQKMKILPAIRQTFACP